MKKLILILLLLVLILGVVPAYAASSGVANESQKHYTEDGAYYIDTLIVQKQSLRALAKDASKTREFYDSNGNLAWTFKVSGTFAYDGNTAKASNAACSSSIKVSGWTCTSKSAYASGASVNGNATFKYNGIPQTAEVKVTCSPSGKIS